MNEPNREAARIAELEEQLSAAEHKLANAEFWYIEAQAALDAANKRVVEWMEKHASAI